jgi:hypothetical protein
MPSHSRLARRRLVLGDDQPNTSSQLAALAADLRELGEVEQARHLDQDTLARRRRVLGDDHPDSLASATGFAADLREVEQADWLEGDILTRYRRLLGSNDRLLVHSLANLRKLRRYRQFWHLAWMSPRPGSAKTDSSSPRSVTCSTWWRREARLSRARPSRKAQQRS